jgi:hypothetical protein
LLKERLGAGRVSFYAATALVDDAEAGASVANSPLAGLREELGRVGLVLEDVLAFLKLDRESVAGGGISRIAGVAQLPGLGVSRVASRERDAGESNEQQEGVRAWYHVRRVCR